MYKVGFIGNKMETPEFLYHDPDISLKFIICEAKKANDDLITFSLVRKITLYQITTIKELDRILKKEKVDFCLMHYFSKKIPSEILKRVDIYNIHPSYLPYYKGRHPLYWATVNNEKSIGISLHKVEPEIDNGEIISQKKIPYYLWMSAKDASNELTKKVPALLYELKEYLKGERKNKPNSKGNYQQPVSDQDITVSIKNDPPDKIFNKVRSQEQYKGAKLVLDKTIWIKKMKFTKSPNGKKFSLGEKYYDKKGRLCIYYKKGIAIKLIE